MPVPLIGKPPLAVLMKSQTIKREEYSPLGRLSADGDIQKLTEAQRTLGDYVDRRLFVVEDLLEMLIPNLTVAQPGTGCFLRCEN
jgi:hypothetical protein